jgi:two-component system, OmpR family, response regulator ChvI
MEFVFAFKSIIKVLQDMTQLTTLQASKQIITTSNTCKKRILIVDDEPDITLTFKIVLESTGLYNVHTFNEPLKALANFNAHLYDLVISDIKMPKMNGYEFTQKVKEIDSRIKICFLTASEDYYCSIIDYKQRRAEYFIRKPIGIEEFTKQMNSILQ